jgi:hypothetical protein
VGTRNVVHGPRLLAWGGNSGFKSFAVAVRETSSGVVVMTNADSGRRLCATVVRRIIGPEHPS